MVFLGLIVCDVGIRIVNIESLMGFAVGFMLPKGARLVCGQEIFFGVWAGLFCLCLWGCFCFCMVFVVLFALGLWCVCAWFVVRFNIACGGVWMLLSVTYAYDAAGFCV